MSSSNVTLEIAGRRYTIACAPGEEAHVEGLGTSISEKLAQIDSLKSQSAERVLLYASLLLADELHEAKLANETAAPDTDAGTVSHTAANDAQADAHAENLEKMADRLEALANQLESGGTNS
ncbi:cell division protein ZapA [Aurantiacibacter rhizosphaerae]|uniref:Cell division protein ZapA n=1 Tax=Aurantiacibacter rhizosphaerae TaxID=2691582 RepID=A0A844XCD7_9SPHN|nr:cell division protein ZapA [Aurantiacibacter rhizosphaerae]MWV28171.1 cell division protein ZapA [Aurantiacibacter rhizosphaerae]